MTDDDEDADFAYPWWISAERAGWRMMIMLTNRRW
jgi:hypothetical protein